MGGDFNLVPNSIIYDLITKHTLDLEVSVYEYSNQKLSEINNLAENSEQLLLLNNHFSNVSSLVYPTKFRNYLLIENVATIIPIFDVFGDEVIFCNVTAFSEKVLAFCFNSIFNESCQENNYYLRRSKKKKHEKQRKKVVSHILSCLAKKINFSSSYSTVKKQGKTDTEFYHHDVMVSQFSQDIKCTLFFEIFILFCY
jgi:DNA topoisomerase VI subunit B